MKYQPIYNRCNFCGKMVFLEKNYAFIRDENKNLLFCNSKCSTNFKKDTPLDKIEPQDLIGRLPTKEKNNNERIDPITLSVIYGALSSIGKEMGKTMTRTAFSPIFFEGNDFTCALFDDKLELIAQFEGNPAQLGSVKYAVGNAVKKIGTKNLFDGDVIIHNDPFLGSPHLPEFCMIKPIFHKEKVISFAAIIAHHPDVGGKDPGSFPGDATEIYQEGILVTPIKIFEKGIQNDSVWELILSNVRIPHETYGDFMAMYGSLVTAELRVNDLIKKYGLKKYLKYIYEVKDYAERIMRSEIAKIPNGIYESIKMVDDDGSSDKSYAIKIKIKVCDEDIIFDFRETDNQARGPINTPYGVGISGPKNAIFNVVDPNLPHNEGAFRPLHFILPPGIFLNANYPFPVSGGNTETYNLVASCVLTALAKAIPERVAASAGDTNALLTGGGLDNRKTNRHFGIVIWEPIGWGGRYSSDGNNAIITFCGLTARNYSTEVIETVYPLMIKKYKLREGSGGEGKYRGGLGVVREYEIQCDEFSVGAHANRHKYPPEGLFGGAKGERTEFLISKDGKFISPIEYSAKAKSPTKFSGLLMKKTQRIIVKSPGGGGYGDVRERNRDIIIDDLKNGYITKEQAIKIYKIINNEADEIISKYWFISE